MGKADIKAIIKTELEGKTFSVPDPSGGDDVEVTFPSNIDTTPFWVMIETLVDAIVDDAVSNIKGGPEFHSSAGGPHSGISISWS